MGYHHNSDATGIELTKDIQYFLGCARVRSYPPMLCRPFHPHDQKNVQLVESDLTVRGVNRQSSQPIGE
jgi:hypothetical protein